MLKAIFTLDYEIHGNGEGDSYKLMVEPTRRIIDLFEEFGAKLTIMADVAEILKFKEYKNYSGRDDYHYEAVVEQLRDAVLRGHDVQLHLHASYFKSLHRNGRWLQHWLEYDFAGLSAGRLTEIVGMGKKFLEDLLKPIAPEYECIAFRAANWSMNPSQNAVRALLVNGFKIDTSVFKYGRRTGRVNFDYTLAYSEVVPWKVEEDNICVRNENGKLLEVPIYSEKRRIGAFVTPQRIYRSLVSRQHKFTEDGNDNGCGKLASGGPKSSKIRSIGLLTQKHAWKADFNQCTGKQLIAAIERADARHGSAARKLPFVLIGHSKLFTRFNASSLAPFLAYVVASPQRFAFATFGEFATNGQAARV